MDEIAITGLGITTPLAQGRQLNLTSLLAGRGHFGLMQRPGRQYGASAFIGAEIETLQLPADVSPRLLRTASWSARVALATVHEAWHDARLEETDPERIGLVVGGSNLQQRELTLLQDSYRDKPTYLRPSYGLSFLDTDIGALCSEYFGIRGTAQTAGGASASGHLAIVQSINLVLSGTVDACIAVGALMDLSYWECQGLRGLGAMGSDRYANQPAAACRPFDAQRDGFIFGESCGAVVVERAARAGREPHALISGWSYQVSGHRNPDTSVEGETRAIRAALSMSGVPAGHFDYVNPHGTGSTLGDEVELRALREVGLQGAAINATKSVIGHGLSAAGAVEVIVTVLQMQAGRLHPTLNLDEPLDPGFDWVRARSREHRMRHALNLSFGFGGINSAICLSSGR